MYLTCYKKAFSLTVERSLAFLQRVCRRKTNLLSIFILYMMEFLLEDLHQLSCIPSYCYMHLFVTYCYMHSFVKYCYIHSYVKYCYIHSFVTYSQIFTLGSSLINLLALSGILKLSQFYHLGLSTIHHPYLSNSKSEGLE